MKHTIYLFTIILTIPIITYPISKAQTIRDGSGIKIGTIDTNGIIRNKAGIKTGIFDKYGNIRDSWQQLKKGQ